jgi:hypothetical protein
MKKCPFIPNSTVVFTEEFKNWALYKCHNVLAVSTSTPTIMAKLSFNVPDIIATSPYSLEAVEFKIYDIMLPARAPQ